MDLKKKVAYRAVIRLHRATSELVNRFLTLSYEYYIITLYKGKYTIKKEMIICTYIPLYNL